MKTKLSNKTIFFYIAVCYSCHLSLYYAVGSIIFAIYSLNGFDGRIPFDFKTWIKFDNCCLYSPNVKVNTLSMCLTYPLSGVVFGTFISSRVWDYALTVTLLHVALSCLVMLSFPTNWSWWLCLGGSCVVMILCGEGVAGLRRYRNSSRLVVPEKQPETISYLHR